MARRAMVTRTFTTKVFNVTYVTTDRQFIDNSVTVFKGEDISKKVEASKPKNSLVLKVEQIAENNEIFGIEVNKFFELAEEVNGRRGLVTKEFTFTTYKVVYVTTDREFIERELIVNDYSDVNELAKSVDMGIVLSIEKIGEPVTVVVGMTYEKFIDNAVKVER